MGPGLFFIRLIFSVAVEIVILRIGWIMKPVKKAFELLSLDLQNARRKTAEKEIDAIGNILRRLGPRIILCKFSALKLMIQIGAIGSI